MPDLREPEDVDGIVRKAASAGGTTHREPRDYGFMCEHGFRDLDGLISMEPGVMRTGRAPAERRDERKTRGGRTVMRPSDYVIVASLSLIVLLELTATETVLPAWINAVVSLAAAVTALLLWQDTRGNDLKKEE